MLSLLSCASFHFLEVPWHMEIDRPLLQYNEASHYSAFIACDKIPLNEECAPVMQAGAWWKKAGTSVAYLHC